MERERRFGAWGSEEHGGRDDEHGGGFGDRERDEGWRRRSGYFGGRDEDWRASRGMLGWNREDDWPCDRDRDFAADRGPHGSQYARGLEGGGTTSREWERERSESSRVARGEMGLGTHGGWGSSLGLASYGNEGSGGSTGYGGRGWASSGGGHHEGREGGSYGGSGTGGYGSYGSYGGTHRGTSREGGGSGTPSWSEGYGGSGMRRERWSDGCGLDAAGGYPREEHRFRDEGRHGDGIMPRNADAVRAVVRGGRDRGPFFGRGPKGYKRSDERIREEVCEVIARQGWIDASDVEVNVHDGEVVLSGTVGEREHKRRLEQMIEDVPGVEDVKNEIRVQRRASAPASSEDDGGRGRGRTS